MYMPNQGLTLGHVWLYPPKCVGDKKFGTSLCFTPIWLKICAAFHTLWRTRYVS